MIFKLRLSAIALFAAILLTACDKPAPAETAAQTEPPPAVETPAEKPAEPQKREIEWFKGGVQEAFALSRAENKPLFLYWGAVWCPPCVEIKATVFMSPQFIAQSKLFIPVYLYGDTASAQIYGDRFGTKVYPTLIVFNPEGEEVTRLHAGMELSAYDTVLELSLDSKLSVTGVAVTDAMATRTELAFEQVKLGQEPAADTFSFTPPAGVEVIEAGFPQ